MESHNHLGIYLRRDRATVVCVAAQGRDRRLLGCFSVSVEPSQEQGQQALAQQIARTCDERGLKFGPVAVALDCEMFMQHAVHSEFTDPKRIAATVRFDTEEALATDVTDVAVAFRIVSSDDNGANLEVFTAQRRVLTEILMALQGAGIDPITVDPDSYCLSRYLAVCGTCGEAPEHRPLYALLSDSRGYLLTLPRASETATMRAFPIAEVQNRESLLAREVLTTTALAEAAGPVGRLCLFDAKAQVSAEQLARKVGRQVEACDLAAMAGAGADDIAGCPNAVDFAAAYGAALTLAEKDRGVNFRDDHMPYQGTKLRMNRALKFLSIAVTVLLLSLGVYLQAQWMTVSKARADVRAKFEPDYVAVMPGKTKLPTTIKKAVSDLEKEVNRLMAEKGIKGTPQESIRAKLALVLQAVISCAAQTGLVIDTISVTMKTIHINGSTTSRRSTDSVLEAMKKAGLTVQDHRVGADGERDNFDMTVSVGPQKALEGN